MQHLTAAALQAPGIVHGFFGRTGGVSGGIYASLNCGPGSGDDLAYVEENRRRVRAALGIEGALLNAWQIHSGTALAVSTPWALGEGPQADGMATATSGIALGILTADCAPVLFADAEARVIGAAHAGWRGAIEGVLEATISRMEALGARRTAICAAIGPCISQPNYEVGPEFLARFVAADPAFARFFVPAARPGHHLFDLPGFAAWQLASSGIGAIEKAGACTYAEEEKYFSYRRNTHRDEQRYGRQVSVIALA